MTYVRTVRIKNECSYLSLNLTLTLCYRALEKKVLAIDSCLMIAYRLVTFISQGQRPQKKVFLRSLDLVINGADEKNNILILARTNAIPLAYNTYLSG